MIICYVTIVIKIVKKFHQLLYNNKEKEQLMFINGISIFPFTVQRSI